MNPTTLMFISKIFNILITEWVITHLDSVGDE